MKKLAILIFTICFVLSANAHGPDKSHDLRDLKKEVYLLKQEIKELQTLILTLQNSINEPSPYESAIEKPWACYITNSKIGGTYGTGFTEAEAKGIALEKCHQLGGHRCSAFGARCDRNEKSRHRGH